MVFENGVGKQMVEWWNSFLNNVSSVLAHRSCIIALSQETAGAAEKRCNVTVPASNVARSADRASFRQAVAAWRWKGICIFGGAIRFDYFLCGSPSNHALGSVPACRAFQPHG